MEEVVGSLKAHEERLRGVTEPTEGKLLLTEEEWRKRENSEGQLLLTREEWLKRSSKEVTRNSGKNRSTNGGRFVRDRSKVKCWNCSGYGHYAAECRKPRRDQNREQRTEVNLTQTSDNEPSLLIAECGENGKEMMMLNEEKVVPTGRSVQEKGSETNVWYLDNGASNHMTGDR